MDDLRLSISTISNLLANVCVIKYHITHLASIHTYYIHLFKTGDKCVHQKYICEPFFYMWIIFYIDIQR